MARSLLCLPLVSALLFLLALVAKANATTITASYGSAADVAVTSAGYNAAGSTVTIQLNFPPAAGSNLTVVKNTGLAFIAGTFTNLAQGQIVALPYAGTTYRFVANYFGGSGNDLVLQWAATRPFAWGENFAGGLGTGTTTTAYFPVPVATSGALAGKTILSLATGYGFSIALCSDGSLAAWGRNSDGQLGNGSFIDSSVPVAVSMSGVLAGKRVVALSAGYDHCVALCADGTAAAWGNNQYGKLGYGTYASASSNVPVAVVTAGALGGKSFVSVSAGYLHSMALCSDGSVACWGSNDYGQLGTGDTEPANVPVAVSNAGVFSGKSAASISAGINSSFAVCSDGTAVSWGSGGWGVLGTGNYDRSYLPVAVTTTGALAGKSVAAISSGYRHTLALCTDGSLIGWGENGDGQLGVETPSYSSQPMAIPLSGALAGKTVTSSTAAYDFSLAVCSDGTLASWGGVNDPTLGNGDYRGSKTPVAVLTKQLAKGEVMMAAATSTYGVHSLALVAIPQVPSIFVEEASGAPVVKDAGTVILGSATAGSTISKTFTIRNKGLEPLSIVGVLPEGAQANDFVISNPPAVSVPAGGSTQLTISFSASSGFGHSARLRISTNDPFDGEFRFSIAATMTGTLEAAYNSASDVPAAAAGFSLAGSSVHFTLNHPPVTGKSLTVLDNTGLNVISGTFGNLAQGQLVALEFAGVTYKYVANYYGGTGNDLVLQCSPNRLLACGANASGQMGTGNTTSSTIPVAVGSAGILAGKTIISAGAGDSHSLALCSDGTLAGWGSGNSGKLGNGSNTSSNVPVAAGVGGAIAGKTVIAIAVGRNHNLALCSDGTLAAWGSNSNGILGDGTTTSRDLPVAVNMSGVLANKRVVAIAAGEYQSLALCSDGTIAAWGYNHYGNLGDETRLDSSVPVLVSFTGALSGKTAISISTGNFHSLALCSDGTLVSWGYNGYGQLGDGSGSEYSKVPSAVSSSGVLAGKTVVAIAAGDYMSAALCSDHMLVTWGYNNGGRLGNGSNVDSPLPVAVTTTGGLSGREPVSLSTGGGQVTVPCGDGSLAVWGMNSSGQLGDNSTVSRSIPVLANSSNLTAGEKFISGVGRQGNSHSLGITAIPYVAKMVLEEPAGSVLASGSLVDFASNPPTGTTSKTFKILNKGIVPLVIGQPSLTGPHASEFVVSTPPAGSVAPGDSTTFVLTFTTGAGFSRTANLHISSNDPYLLDFQLKLTAQGSGILNAAYSSALDVPLTLPGLIATGSQVNFSLNFAPAPGTALTVVQATGTAFIQGHFENLAQGQMVILSYTGKSYKFVANYYGGSGNDLVLQWAGVRLLSWGGNGTGSALGRSSYSGNKAPGAVSTSGVLAGKVILMQAVGRNHSLALCSDGTLAAWGSNKVGQLGDGTTTDRSQPTAVDQSGVLSGRTVISIAAAGDHSLALCLDGTMVAWGYGGSGVLGNGTSSSSSVPVAVSATGVLLGKTVVSVTTGELHSVAVCADGTVFTWGGNLDRQLGNGTSITSSNVPVPVTISGVLAGKAVIRAVAGTSHTLALCSDGTLVAWGYNSSGQLGNDSSITGSTPVAVVTTGVLAGKTVASIAAGDNHSLALCTDATLAAWGNNASGQLGNGLISSTNNQPLAVPNTGVLSGNAPKFITAGYRDSLALLADGSVATWGLNLSGQLGDGTSVTRKLPGLIARGEILPDERIIGTATGSTANHTLALAAYPFGPRMAVETQDDHVIVADGESIEIGKILPASSITRTILIRNPGDADLANLSISLNGADAGKFNLGPLTSSTLAPGGTTSVTVTFSPTDTVVSTATLQLTGNPAATSGTYAINLTGIGLTRSQAWRLNYFQTIDNTGVAADLATPQNDGISNLMKFATGMNPTLPGVIPGALGISGEFMVFTYPHAKAAAADGIIFTVEWSDDLGVSPWSHSEVVETIQDQGDTELVTALIPAGQESHRFIRLRVVRP